MVSINNHHYYLCIVNDFSKYSWVYPLTTKSEVTIVFLQFKQMAEHYFFSKIIYVQSDNSGKFCPL